MSRWRSLAVGVTTLAFLGMVVLNAAPPHQPAAGTAAPGQTATAVTAAVPAAEPAVRPAAVETRATPDDVIPAPRAVDASRPVKCGTASARPTNCPEEHEYLRRWAERLGAGAARQWTIVDVGVNKGYSVAALLEALGVRGHSRRALGRAIFRTSMAGALTPRKFRPSLCGACCECGDAPMPPPRNFSGATAAVHAFDGTASHVDFVRGFFEALPAVSAGSSVTVRHAAVTRRSGGFAHFPQLSLGVELAGIGPAVAKQNGPADKTAVPMVSVDDAVASLPFIDVLLTDTEGHDYRVADGAAKFLDGGKVGLYVFELADTTRKLGAHVRRLEAAGYECYFPLHDRVDGAAARYVQRISHGCYRAAFDAFAGWNNALCVNLRVPALVAAMRALERADKPFKSCSNGVLRNAINTLPDDLKEYAHGLKAKKKPPTAAR
jgi:hypothetical protein